MIKLIIEDDEGKSTIVPLVRDEILIGRKQGNTIRLTERNVSRQHAKLTRIDGAVYIEDLNSYNGIKVNGEKIDGRVVVDEGDRIQIGDYLLGLASADEDDDTALTPQLEESADEQPTVRTVAAESRRPKRSPRLVCVSRNLAGKEWTLDKEQFVIGRVRENDAVIDHRSISRHHARLIRQNGSTRIVDLQSANGIRVNGKVMQETMLKRGDFVDLGYVRLRYVDPAEDFVFARDADVVDLSGADNLRRYGVMALFLLVIVGLAGYFGWLPAPLQRLIPAGLTRTPAVQTAQPSTTDAIEQRAAMEADANRRKQVAVAADRRDWRTVLEHCAELSAKSLLALQETCQQAQKEAEAAKLLVQAVAAAEQGDHHHALQLVQQIPDGSVTHAELQQSAAINAAREAYRGTLREQTRSLIAKGECEAAAANVSNARDLVGDVEVFEQAVERCRPRRRTSPDRSAASRETKPNEPEATAPSRRAEQQTAPVERASPAQVTDQQRREAELLVMQAQTAYGQGNYARAMSLAEKSLTSVPQEPMAWQIIGASACYLRNEVAARRAYRRVPPTRRELLQTLCDRLGISLK